MSWSTTVRNAEVDAVATIINRIGLADATGTELTGGSYNGPFTPSWGAASGGIKTATAAAVTVPASTVAFVLFMADATPDVVHATVPYMAGSTDPIIKAASVTTDDVFASAGHGFVDNDRLSVYSMIGAALPTGLSTAPTLYYVRDATTNTFKVAATAGGVAIDITAAGLCWVHQGLPEVFAAPGTTTVTAKLDGRVV